MKWGRNGRLWGALGGISFSGPPCSLGCCPFFVFLQIQDRRLRVVFSVALAREVRLHFPQLIPPRLRAAACLSNMQVKSEVALMPLGQTAEPEESRVTALVAMPFSLLVTRVSRLLMRVEERPSSVMTPDCAVASFFPPCPVPRPRRRIVPRPHRWISLGFGPRALLCGSFFACTTPAFARSTPREPPVSSPCPVPRRRRRIPLGLDPVSFPSSFPFARVVCTVRMIIVYECSV
jgi:hypothetical protein